jgi:hypothetical protein
MKGRLTTIVMVVSTSVMPYAGPILSALPAVSFAF